MQTSNPLTLLDKYVESALTSDTLGWMTRSEIAQALGRKILTTYQIGRLEHLVLIGRVEKEERRKGIAKTYFVYRLKELS